MVKLFIGIFLLQLAVKTTGDWLYKKYKRKVINHGLSVAIDFTVYATLSYLAFHTISLLAVVGGVFTLAGGRWILYDLLYNLINKHKWDHYGKSSKLDRFLNKIGKCHMIPKVLLIIVGLLLIII